MIEAQDFSDDVDQFRSDFQAATKLLGLTESIKQRLSAEGVFFRDSDVAQFLSSGQLVARLVMANGVRSNHALTLDDLDSWRADNLLFLSRRHQIDLPLAERWLSAKEVFCYCGYCRRRYYIEPSSYGSSYDHPNFNGNKAFETPEEYKRAEDLAATTDWYCHVHRDQAWSEKRRIADNLLEALFKMKDSQEWTPSRLGIDRDEATFLIGAGLALVRYGAKGSIKVRHLTISSAGMKHVQSALN